VLEHPNGEVEDFAKPFDDGPPMVGLVHPAIDEAVAEPAWGIRLANNAPL
jgi:hypothetical protein